MKLIGHYINGKIIKQSENTSLVFNPASGEEIAKVSLADEQIISDCVSYAIEAFNKWQYVTPLKRARIMMKYNQLLRDNFNEISANITREHGKVAEDAAGELTRGIEVVEFATSIPHLLKGEHSLNVGSKIDCFTLYKPLGVCAGITPFNFPAMVPMWMYPLAIACGNSFILKPSEKDPSTAIMLAEIFSEAGLPDGVFNVINGDKVAVEAILNHPDIAAISFVGSTPIARYINETGVRAGKRIQALGGAKNHMVVMPDSDIEIASNALMGAAFGSAGERCMAISVAVAVSDEVADKLIENLVPKIKALKIGNGGITKGLDMGPLVSADHLKRVSDYIEVGLKEGAKLIIDGREFKHHEYKNGFYLGGSLFDQVSPEMKIYREEIFGPVLVVMRVENLNEAIKLINDHEFGNGSAIFTQFGAAAREFNDKVKTGMIGVNVPIPVPLAFHSFGGMKNSNYSPLNIHGMDGVRFYTQMKTITQRWYHDENNPFIMPTF